MDGRILRHREANLKHHGRLDSAHVLEMGKQAAFRKDTR
jgi:hypothetical protein